MRSDIGLCVMCLAALALWSSMALGAAEEDFAVVGCDRIGVAVLRDDALLFKMKSPFHGWGWKHPRMEALAEVRNDVRVFEQELAFYEHWTRPEPLPGRIDLEYTLEQTAPDTFLMTYRCRPDREMRFTMPGRMDEPKATVGPVVPPCSYLDGGTCRLVREDGSIQEMPLPTPRGSTDRVKEAILRTPEGETIRFTFEPALQVHRDMNETRFWAQSQDTVAAGETYTQKITMQLPGAAEFEPGNRWVDTSDWFPLEIENDFASPSPVAAHDWQDAPAGRHGFLQMKGDRFEFEDGTPGRFWGVNLINYQVDRELFDRWAEALAKYGVNLVRMVAFGRPNNDRWAHYIKLQDVEDGLKFDPESIDLFDYGFAQMKEKGIYVGFSPFYGWYPTPADEERLIDYEEAMKLLRKGFPCSGSFYGVTCVMPDVQQLQIEFHKRLLDHKNPYTGKRYADDPALAYVELQNEENIFLQLRGLEGQLAQCPTYKKLFYGRFADWLEEKYGSREKLAEVWGGELKPAENLREANISPFPAWFQGNTSSPRIADQMAFIYSTQRDYYRRFAQAVRETGYRGAMDASCWQASDWLGHLYNVLSDRDIGFIDRHNYATADLKNPGVGLLSPGLQAVLDRPFSYSEWHGGYRMGMSLDVPMIAVYGMGLQGWDMSMEFAWAQAGALPYDHLGINDVCNDYGVLCQYPALARMVRRGDVRQGEVVGNRRVSIPALKEGDVGFVEQFSLLNGANNKRFDAAVPQAALAAGRVVLEYVDGSVDRPVIDRSGPYIDEEAHTVRSTTGQLLWDVSGEGYFTVDTPGTKGVVGYGGGRSHELGEVTIEQGSPYAHIYVTATDKDAEIATDDSLLVTAMARMVDKGTEFDAFSEAPLVRVPPKVGPLLIEPVRATITIKRDGPCRVYALDHDGRKPADAAEIPVEKTPDGLRFTVDGTKHKTVYYVVEWGG